MMYGKKCARCNRPSEGLFDLQYLNWDRLCSWCYDIVSEWGRVAMNPNRKPNPGHIVTIGNLSLWTCQSGCCHY
jgi:hypothetical protein